MNPPQVSTQEREVIVDLIRAGVGRNEICRRVARSQGVVTKIAQQEGLNFERAVETAPAQRIRSEEQRARRARLAASLLDQAERLLDQMGRPAVIHGGMAFERRDLDEPTFADKRNIMQAFAIALEKHLQLLAAAADEGRGASAIVDLIDALRPLRLAAEREAREEERAATEGGGATQQQVAPSPPSRAHAGAGGALIHRRRRDRQLRGSR